MANVLEAELAKRLQDAHAHVDVGARYAHYKSHDKTYLVTGLAIWEATGEVVVSYEAEYGMHIAYVRALSVWLESVDKEGEQVPRFTKVLTQ